MKKAVLALIVLTVVVLLFVSIGSAFNRADLQRLEATGGCVECDLSGAVLIHMNLGGADLSGSDLTGANLTDAWLAGASLEGADLTGAILISTSLAGADLIGAKLGGANLLFTDLAGARWVDGSLCKRPSSGSCKR